MKTPTTGRIGTGTLALVAMALTATLAWAGNLESPAVPDAPASALVTLEDIHNRLTDGTPGQKRGEGFVRPATGPTVGTMRTLDELMAAAPAPDASGAVDNQVAAGKTYWGLTAGAWGPRTGTGTGEGEDSPPVYLASLPKTGAGEIGGYSLVAGEDGHAAMRRGVAWPDPRFTDNGDGTVTDRLTGLIWLQNAAAFGTRNWATALADCAALATGQHGLSDGSAAGDWRLPNVKELRSLVNYGSASGPGAPFTGVATGEPMYESYWSGTTDEISPETAWAVAMEGDVFRLAKDIPFHVWPVRGGPAAGGEAGMAGMVAVPGGTLGSITVDSFVIGEHEVTWGLWKQYRAAAGYDLAAAGDGCTDDHPVHSLTWYEAVKWCNARSEEDGLTPVYTVGGSVYRTGAQDSVDADPAADGWRLPVSDESKFAAQGGLLSQGFLYSGSDSAGDVAWYYNNSFGAACAGEGSGVWPVGSKAANELGLHDMSGNVAEWCFDWFNAWNGLMPVRFGGSFDSFDMDVHAQYWNVAEPTFAWQNTGFRLARSAAP